MEHYKDENIELITKLEEITKQNMHLE